MSQSKRRHFTTEQKGEILRRHLGDKVPVSDLCDEYGIQPSLFYTWQRQLLTNASAALEDGRTRRGQRATASRDQEKIEALEAKLAKKDSVIAEISEEYVELKNAWGELKGRWVPHDVRDSVVDFVRNLATRTELPVQKILGWLDLATGKFYRWRDRYGRINQHNSWVPRDHWITPWERNSIIRYYDAHPLNGYRRLAFMMLDEDVVAVSPSTTYRVLTTAGRLDRWNGKPSKKGTGFVQPLFPHAHWHVDIAYLNIASTFYYLCSILDGFSRFLVHWEIRESMKEVDIETILQRARELYPEAKPRVITDNGPQFIAGDFRKFIRLSGMTHVKTSPYYPQSNGKIERWHRTLKATTIRPQAPGSVEAARRMVGTFVDHYNHKRLHSALGFITPADKLAGREKDIWTVRDQRLEAARAKRRIEHCTVSAVAGSNCVVQL